MMKYKLEKHQKKNQELILKLHDYLSNNQISPPEVKCPYCHINVTEETEKCINNHPLQFCIRTQILIKDPGNIYCYRCNVYSIPLYTHRNQSSAFCWIHKNEPDRCPLCRELLL